MKATDFRIGNSIWYQESMYKKSDKNEGHEMIVIEAADDPAVILEVPVKDVMPIKLTPELLIEIGFTEVYVTGSSVPSYAWFDPYEDILFTLDAQDDEFDEFTVFIQQDKYSESLCLCYIRYYHQWENLFYMVNGREIGEKPERPNF